MRHALTIALTEGEEATLRHLAMQKEDARLSVRAQLVLRAARGEQNKEIATALGIGRVQVARWRERFAQNGLGGLGVTEVSKPPVGPVDVSPEPLNTRMDGLRHRPPPPAVNLIARDALLARLIDARRQRCVFIRGQAGSGKTSALLAWRRALISLDFDVAWFALAPEDDDFPSFCCGLQASLNVVVPGLLDLEEITDSESSPDALERWVIALVQRCENLPRDLVLMLDDFHLITDSRALKALQFLCDYLPPRLHLAIASRTGPLISLERLRAQGALTEVGQTELSFCIEESEQFLRRRLGRIDLQNVRRLHELTAGWVAGLQLFVLHMRTQESSRFVPVAVCDEASFSTYVEREVLSHLSGHELTCAAACSRFSPSLLATLMGEPGNAEHMASLLLQLEGDNFFISQISGRWSDAWYRLHPLLRQTLLKRLNTRSSDALHAMHGRASRWWRDHGGIEEAVHHAKAAGDGVNVAGMVADHALKLLELGALARLSGLMRSLTADQIASRFSLLMVSAYLHMYGRNFSALASTLETMATQVGGNPDRHQELILLRAAMWVQQDNLVKLVPMVPAISGLPPGASDRMWIARNNLLCWFHARSGNHAQALEVMSATADLTGAPRSRLLGRCLEAMSQAQHGQVHQAERAAREVLRIAQQYKATFGAIAGAAAVLLAQILHEMGDLAAARVLIEPRMDSMRSMALPDTMLAATLVLEDVHVALGEDAMAQTCLDRLEKIASQASMHRLLAETRLVRLQRLLDAGRTEQAYSVLMLIQRGAVDSAEHDATVHSVTRADVLMAMHGQDYRSAMLKLEALVQLGRADRHQAQWHLTWARAAAMACPASVTESVRM